PTWLLQKSFNSDDVGKGTYQPALNRGNARHPVVEGQHTRRRAGQCQQFFQCLDLRKCAYNGFFNDDTRDGRRKGLVKDSKMLQGSSGNKQSIERMGEKLSK